MNPARARSCERVGAIMSAQQVAQMLPFVLPVDNSSATEGGACALCILEAAGGALRMHGASCVDKSDCTHVVLRLQKCAHVMHCGVLASCDEQFAGCVSGADAGRVVGSQALAARWVCWSRRCALLRRGRYWRACDFSSEKLSFVIRLYHITCTTPPPHISRETLVPVRCLCRALGSAIHCA